VDNTFSKHFDIGTTIPWKNETYLRYEAITLSNRYFTDASKRSYLQGVPFTQAEDPSGKLSELSKDVGFVHCEENVVKYFFLQKNRYVSIKSPGR